MAQLEKKLTTYLHSKKGAETGVTHGTSPKLAITLLIFSFFTNAVQSQVNEDEASNKEHQGQVLEEVYVTATKRSKSSRDVPISIDAFSGADLDERGLTNLEEILKYSPGVTLNKGRSPDSNQVNIRGAGSAGGDFNRPFGLFFEDVPLLNPTLIGSQPDIDPFDLATVEVLKGPQGTLFGGSALVGAIRYVPNAPRFDEIAGSLSYGEGATSSSDGTNRQHTVMLNYPITDSLAFRVATSKRTRAGIIDDTYSGEKDVNGIHSEHQRIIIAWEVLENLSLQATYQDREVVGDATAAAAIDNSDGRQEYGMRRGVRDESVSNMDIAGLKLEWSGFEYFSVSMISNALSKNAGFWLDSSFGSVPEGDEFRSSLEKLTTTDQVTHEFRLVSNAKSESAWWVAKNWEYVAGIFYMQSEQVMDLAVVLTEANPQEFPLSPIVPIGIDDALVELLVDTNADAVEKAYFFDATRTFFNERLELNVGGRYFEQTTPVFLSVHAVSNTAAGTTPPAKIGEDASDTLEEVGFNPKAALTFNIQDELFVYLSAAKGFRFGGVNADPFLTGEPPVFYESDSLWNYEVGLRSTWLDNSVQFDITTFFIEWDNKQVSQLTTSTPPSEFITNIGGSQMRGAEFILRTALPHGFSWMINGAYVDSRTTKDFNSASEGHIPEGTRESGTPLWTGATALNFKDRWWDWDVSASIAYTYRSKLISNSLPLGEIGTADLSVRIANPGWKLAPEVSINWLNFENDKSLTGGSTNGAPEGDPNRLVIAQAVTPRTLMMNLKLSF